MSGCAKIDITINQDWSKIISIHSDIKKRWQEEKLPEKYGSDNLDNSIRYEFGTSGAFVPYQGGQEGEPMVSSLMGEIFTAKLNWIPTLQEDMKELNPQFSFQETNGSFSRHKDGEEKGSHFHCKLNWVINDYVGRTYVENDDGTINSYPSLKGGYLLDTTKFHWVECNDTRYCMQFVFHKSFKEVFEWFNDHPNLVYSG